MGIKYKDNQFWTKMISLLVFSFYLKIDLFNKLFSEKKHGDKNLSLQLFI